MKLLFVNNLGSTTEDNSPPCNNPGSPTPSQDPVPLKKFFTLLLEQCVNSTIVAGIASLSVWAGTDSIDWQSPVIAFGVTFLAELRKYRNLF